MHRRQMILSGLATAAGASSLTACASAPARDPNYPIRSDQNAQAYTFDELVAAGSRELGIAAEVVGGAIERVFADQGDRPTPTSRARRAPAPSWSAPATAAARCT